MTSEVAVLVVVSTHTHAHTHTHTHTHTHRTCTHTHTHTSLEDKNIGAIELCCMVFINAQDVFIFMRGCIHVNKVCPLLRFPCVYCLVCTYAALLGMGLVCHACQCLLKILLHIITLLFFLPFDLSKFLPLAMKSTSVRRFAGKAWASFSCKSLN